MVIVNPAVNASVTQVILAYTIDQSDTAINEFRIGKRQIPTFHQLLME